MRLYDPKNIRLAKISFQFKRLKILKIIFRKIWIVNKLSIFFHYNSSNFLFIMSHVVSRKKLIKISGRFHPSCAIF